MIQFTHSLTVLLFFLHRVLGCDDGCSCTGNKVTWENRNAQCTNGGGSSSANTDGSSDSGSSSGLGSSGLSIALAVLAGVAFLALIAIVVGIIVVRRRRQQLEDASSDASSRHSRDSRPTVASLAAMLSSGPAALRGYRGATSDSTHNPLYEMEMQMDEEMRREAALEAREDRI